MNLTLIRSLLAPTLVGADRSWPRLSSQPAHRSASRRSRLWGAGLLVAVLAATLAPAIGQTAPDTAVKPTQLPPQLGLAELPATAQHGPITVFYPSSSPQAPVQRGPFSLDAAVDGTLAAGPHRLVVISHGSGGNPWPYADLARTLTQAAYVVAVPEHDGDNSHNMQMVGPESWKRRPGEVSAAIDAVAADPRWAAGLDSTRVGVFGLSAGGLTALVLGGGAWSPRHFQQHCLQHMEEDFNACVGLATSLTGGWADGLKTGLARLVHRLLFGDDTLYRHEDPRIKAVVAAVPMAAPFDLDSFARDGIPIGLMRGGADAWLHPPFHIDAVRSHCTRCELLMDDPHAGHGSLFSPWPQALAERLTPLLQDPPGFQRATLPATFERLRSFMDRHLQP